MSKRTVCDSCDVAMPRHAIEDDRWQVRIEQQTLLKNGSWGPEWGSWMSISDFQKAYYSENERKLEHRCHACQRHESLIEALEAIAKKGS